MLSSCFLDFPVSEGAFDKLRLSQISYFLSCKHCLLNFFTGLKEKSLEAMGWSDTTVWCVRGILTFDKIYKHWRLDHTSRSTGTLLFHTLTWMINIVINTKIGTTIVRLYFYALIEFVSILVLKIDFKIYYWCTFYILSRIFNVHPFDNACG